MIVYRISTPQFASDLSGLGSFLYGGRWNSEYVSILYTAESVSGALLELLVRYPVKNKPEYHLVEIEIPDNLEHLIVDINNLESDWKEKSHLHYTRSIGDDFINKQKGFSLKVPSAIVPKTFNILLNPLHKDFRLLKILSKQDFNIDERIMERFSNQ